jgi:hypothetical protein
MCHNPKIRREGLGARAHRRGKLGGGALVSEGQWRQPLKHNHGIGVLEDLRTGQEGTVRGLPVVNCSGETEEGGGGTY